MSERIPLQHIAQRMYNSPLMITVDAAHVINRVFSDIVATKAGWLSQDERTDVQVFAPVKDEASGTAIVYAPRASGFVGAVPRDPITGAPAPYRVANGTAIFRIVGELVNRGEWLNASSGMVAYEGIKHQCATARVDPFVKNVIIDMRTPGGEAEGCFDCAAEIRKLAAVKPVVCFVNGLACSAGYALASACTRIVSIPEGRSGSIGVLMMHVDYSVALQLEGIKPTFIFAGAHKVDGNPYAPLPVDVQARYQAEIEKTYAMFIATVIEGRPNLTDQAIRDTGALVYSGADALALGLIDSIGTFEDLLIEMTTPDQVTVNVAEDMKAQAQELPMSAAVTEPAATMKEKAASGDCPECGSPDCPGPDEDGCSGQDCGCCDACAEMADSKAKSATKENGMDMKKMLTAVGAALLLVEKEDAGATAQDATESGATQQAPSKQGGSRALEDGVTMHSGVSLITPTHFSAKAGGSELQLCGAPASEKSVTAIDAATCSDCLHLEIKRRDDEAAAVIDAEKAKALLGVEAAADAFIAAKCGNLGKEATAAYRARYVAFATAGDSTAIADLETMAASIGPRRSERADTSKGPNVTDVASTKTPMEVHDAALAKARATVPENDAAAFNAAYLKARAEIMSEMEVAHVATA